MRVYSHEPFQQFDESKNADEIKNCDFVYFSLRTKPKYDKIYEITESNVPAVKEVLDLCNKYNKYLVYVCLGDSPPSILPNRKKVYVYKTSVDRNRPSNEFVLGVQVEDKFTGKYIEDNKLSIGFVGQTSGERFRYLNYLEKSNIQTDFIKRELDFDRYKNSKEVLTKEFFENMEKNMFIFCYRGRGNFSIRFYETLMMGRIPIVINTDNIYPYMDKINYSDVGLFIEESDLTRNMDLEKRILDYYHRNKDRFLEIQKKNRAIYVKYFSKEHFSDELFLDIKQRIDKEKGI